MIYADRTLGGEWVHCPDMRLCRRHHRRLPRPSGIWTCLLPFGSWPVLGAGPPAKYMTADILHAYATNIAYRLSIRQLWRGGPRDTDQHEAIQLRDLVRRFGFLRDTIVSEWHNRGGRFIGATDTYKLRRVFQPQRSRPRPAPTRSGYAQRGDDRLSPDNPLSPDVVILPFFDLPGRISSLGVIGNTKREGRLHMACRRLNTDRSPVTTENGLWMFDNLLGDTEPGFHTTFVFDDPLLALQLQLRHLRNNSRPLPIVAMFCNGKYRPEHVWEQNWLKDYTFWSTKIDADLIQQAKLADGHVALCETTKAAALAQILTLEPTVWLHGLQRARVHWHRGLERCLQTLSDEPAKALALSLGLDAMERQRYMEQVSPAGAARFRELVPDLARKACTYRGLPYRRRISAGSARITILGS